MVLVDMDKHKWDSGGIYWILTAIETLSRYAVAFPVSMEGHKQYDNSKNEAEVWTTLPKFKLVRYQNSR